MDDGSQQRCWRSVDVQWHIQVEIQHAQSKWLQIHQSNQLITKSSHGIPWVSSSSPSRFLRVRGERAAGAVARRGELCSWWSTVVCFTSSSTFIKIIDQQGWCPLKNVIPFNCLKLMFKTTQEQVDVENPCSNHTKKMSQFGLLLPRRKKNRGGNGWEQDQAKTPCISNPSAWVPLDQSPPSRAFQPGWWHFWHKNCAQCPCLPITKILKAYPNPPKT